MSAREYTSLEDSDFQPTPEQAEILNKFKGDLQMAMLEVLRTAPALSDYVLFPRVNQPLKDAIERACAEYTGWEDLKKLTFAYEGVPGQMLVTVSGPPEVMARLVAANIDSAPHSSPCEYINVNVEVVDKEEQ